MNTAAGRYVIVPADPAQPAYAVYRGESSYETIRAAVEGWIAVLVEVPYGDGSVILWGNDEARDARMPANRRVNAMLDFLGMEATTYIAGPATMQALDENMRPVGPIEAIGSADLGAPIGFALGTVVITGGTDDEGDTLALDDQAVAALLDMFGGTTA